MMRGSYLIIALTPALGTCCPTLWLQVHKGSPAPWPAVEVPRVERGPYSIPPSALNRFDVFHRGTRTVAARGYTDVFDPRDAVASAQEYAVQDRTWIEQKYGRPEPDRCDTPARLYCLPTDHRGSDAGCHRLVLDSAVAQVAAVTIRGRLVTAQLTDAEHRSLDLRSSVPGTNGETVKVCLHNKVDLSRTLLSFVHMSDIQLRDPSITLTDRRLSHQLDWFDALASFEYDPDLMFHNESLIQAMFATINALAPDARDQNPAPDAPRFVVHTGDALDTGAISELRRIHMLIDRLAIPFYDLLGNHDQMVFGNLLPTRTHASDASCTPVSALIDSWATPHRLCVDQRVHCPTCIGDEGDLVARDTLQETRKRFIDGLRHERADVVPQPRQRRPGWYCDNTVPGVRNAAYSRVHGFDLGAVTEENGKLVDDLDGTALGYYAFVEPLDGTDGRHAVFIALDGEDLAPGQGGAGGRIGRAQFAWLAGVLSCVERSHPADLVVVLAHQPLSALEVDPRDAAGGGRYAVASLLEASPNVVGYFYGHHHSHAVCADHRPGGRHPVCARFWEVETAGLIEFPQEARIVRIKQIGAGLGFLELTALRERLADPSSALARSVELARRGAERDFCFTYRGTPRGWCSPDERPYRTDGRDANVRLFFQMPEGSSDDR